MDKLANGGVRFTNGYASSATCSPSRYALLTGTYPWRNKNAKVLPGTAPLLISTDQETVPKMFRSAGYHTGIVGKWHLVIHVSKGLIELFIIVIADPDHAVLHHKSLVEIIVELIPGNFDIPSDQVRSIKQGYPLFLFR